MFIKSNNFFKRRSNSPTPVVIDVAKMASLNYPYTPREPSTVSIRSSSQSSVQSAASSTYQRRRSGGDSNKISNEELEGRAISILNTLSSSPSSDFSSLLSPYISESVVFEHNDEIPTFTLSELFDIWEMKRGRFPNLKLDVREACVDETQRKVWVRSEIKGTMNLGDGLVKESVKMMTFDEEGVLTKLVDTMQIQRKDD